jgi:hypothetical protein
MWAGQHTLSMFQARRLQLRAHLCNQISHIQGSWPRNSIIGFVSRWRCLQMRARPTIRRLPGASSAPYASHVQRAFSCTSSSRLTHQEGVRLLIDWSTSHLTSTKKPSSEVFITVPA